MSIFKSFVLPATFPSSKNSFHELKAAVEYIERFDFPVIEYYCENCDPDNVRELFKNRKSVFLAASLQKSQDLNPCSYNYNDRKRAIKALIECFKFAKQAGADSVLINSGRRPENIKDDEICLKYLRDSICELHHQVKDIDILLEPGDRDVEYHHLIGYTDMAVSFIEDIRSEVPCISLVFDISHIAQLNEDLFSSWTIAKKYCNHVHLANCVLDKTSPLYGDKHPLFSVEDGSISHETALSFYNFLKNEDSHLTVGIEVICPGGSEQDFFDHLVSETKWFFEDR